MLDRVHSDLESIHGDFHGSQARTFGSVKMATHFVRLTHEAFRLCASLGIATLCEHPEDLGTTPSGGTPSSIWALPETFAVSSEIGGSSAALYQCAFGTDYAKPTRLWGTLKRISSLPHCQWPSFSQHGKYLGPLPPSCGHRHATKLVGRHPDGSFNTSSTAAYPPLMCAMIAGLIVEDFWARKSLEKGPSSALQGEGSAEGPAGSSVERGESGLHLSGSGICRVRKAADS